MVVIDIDPTPLIDDHRGDDVDFVDGKGHRRSDDDDASSTSTPGKKRGHRVLYCCDTRRAALIFTIIQFVINILGLLSITLLDTVPFSIITCILYSASMVFYLLVLYGIIYYRRCAVLLSLVWEIIAIVLVIVSAAIFDWKSVNGASDQTEKVAMIVIIAGIVAWRVLVIYSLGMFVTEVRSGVMSVESHDREKYSCCCNV